MKSSDESFFAVSSSMKYECLRLILDCYSHSYFLYPFLYSSRLVCRCAIAASKKGYVYFGIQFYGECWSSADADSRFHMYGATNNCVNTDYNPCDDQARNEACAGANHSNYVYEIVKGMFLTVAQASLSAGTPSFISTLRML